MANPLPPPPDVYGRTPFQHIALEGIQGLTEQSRSLIEDTKNLKTLALRYKLDKVIRWKPKKVTGDPWILCSLPGNLG